MPGRASPSIDALVREAVDDAIQRAAEEIARAIAGMAAEELTSQLEAKVIGGGRGASAGARGRSRGAGEMTRWVADRRARRVPTFVIELTGLETIRLVRQIKSLLPCILMSAALDEFVIEQARLLHAFSVLPKPMTFRQLTGVVRQALERTYDWHGPQARGA